MSEQTAAEELTPELLEQLRNAAEQGNAEAQYRFGLIHANGQAGQLDYVEGARWLTASAEQNYAPAMRTLAWLHANGYGVEQDMAQTRRWFTTAAEQGDPAAQTAVAAMYHFGHYEAEKDMGKAMQWYGRAAEQGHATAQFALGKLMARGEQVQENPEAAFQWLTLAIMSGSEPAKKELSMLTARLDDEDIEQYKQRMMTALAQEPVRH